MLYLIQKRLYLIKRDKQFYLIVIIYNKKIMCLIVKTKIYTLLLNLYKV